MSRQSFVPRRSFVPRQSFTSWPGLDRPSTPDRSGWDATAHPLSGLTPGSDPAVVGRRGVCPLCFKARETFAGRQCRRRGLCRHRTGALVVEQSRAAFRFLRRQLGRVLRQVGADRQAALHGRTGADLLERALEVLEFLDVRALVFPVHCPRNRSCRRSCTRGRRHGDFCTTEHGGCLLVVRRWPSV